MRRLARFGGLAVIAAAAAVSVAAPPERTGAVRVEVAPDRADWTYAPGTEVTFTVRVLRDGHPIPGVTARVRIGVEKMPPMLDQKLPVPPEGLIIGKQTLAEPGFLRCEAEVEIAGRKYRGLATAGFAPDLIKPTTVDPQDFDAFWAAGRKELAAIPVAAKIIPLPERSTSTVDVFHVILQNVASRTPLPGDSRGGTSQIYGILCEPKGTGPFPALLHVPGAGVRAYEGLVTLAEKGIITFQIGIHGLPVNLDPAVYAALGRGALAGYASFNLDDRDSYYFRRVYLGAVRANDFLAHHPKWDRKNLGVMGGSQGGALSIVTAALDPRVRALVSYFPALSDLNGYQFGRAGGWPHMFRTEGARTSVRIEAASYYDVVNFARRLKVPGFFSWGYNDETCPPTSMFAAYNVITAPKKLLLALETGHAYSKEQSDAAEAWMEATLKGSRANVRRTSPDARVGTGLVSP